MGKFAAPSAALTGAIRWSKATKHTSPAMARSGLFCIAGDVTALSCVMAAVDEAIHWTTEVAIIGVIVALVVIFHIYASSQVEKKEKKKVMREIERINEKNEQKKTR